MTTIITNGAIRPSTSDTPTDDRTRIATLTDITTINVPFTGMHFYVTSTGNEYVVKSLKSKTVSGIVVPNAEINTYEKINNITSVTLNGNTYVPYNGVIDLGEISSADGTSNYNNLANKPTIDGTTLTSLTTSESLYLLKSETGESGVDLEITDSGGNSLVKFANGHIQTSLFNSSNISVDDTAKPLKILFISNSFGCDAFAYLPMLCAKHNITVTLGIAHYPWGSLKQHWDNRGINLYTSPLNAGYWKSSGITWTRVDSGLTTILNDEEWDIVGLLQNPAHEEYYDGVSGSYDGYQPYLDNLIGFIKDICGDKVKLAWQFSHPKANATDRVSVVYQHLLTAAKRVLAETDIDLLVPNATAIENARTSIIKNIGGTNLLTSDTLHLDDRVGRLCAAHTWFETVIAPFIGIKSYSKSYIPPQVIDFTIPNSRTSPAYQATLWQCEIAKLAAKYAAENPYKITDMSSITL